MEPFGVLVLVGAFIAATDQRPSGWARATEQLRVAVSSRRIIRQFVEMETEKPVRAPGVVPAAVLAEDVIAVLELAAQQVIWTGDDLASSGRSLSTSMLALSWMPVSDVVAHGLPVFEEEDAQPARGAFIRVSGRVVTALMGTVRTVLDLGFDVHRGGHARAEGGPAAVPAGQQVVVALRAGCAP